MNSANFESWLYHARAVQVLVHRSWLRVEKISVNFAGNFRGFCQTVVLFSFDLNVSTIIIGIFSFLYNLHLSERAFSCMNMLLSILQILFPQFLLFLNILGFLFLMLSLFFCVKASHNISHSVIFLQRFSEYFITFGLNLGKI